MKNKNKLLQKIEETTYRYHNKKFRFFLFLLKKAYLCKIQYNKAIY